MAQPDIEDVIDGVTSYLQANLASCLAVVDARKTTQLNPKPPIQWIFGDKGNIPQMPSLLVTGHDAKTTKDEYGFRQQTYPLMIEAYYTDSDVSRLSRIMRRYGAAIDDCLRADNTLGGIAKDIANIQQQYWDSISAKTGLFQVVQVAFDVTVITD